MGETYSNISFNSLMMSNIGKNFGHAPFILQTMLLTEVSEVNFNHQTGKILAFLTSEGS